jgi:hypothetical protein
LHPPRVKLLGQDEGDEIVAASDTLKTASIDVYTLAVACLLDAPIGNNGLAEPVRAEQISPNYFYIWHIDDHCKTKWFDGLAAACTYETTTGVWTVHLISGESMRLLDHGDLWESVEPNCPDASETSADLTANFTPDLKEESARPESDPCAKSCTRACLESLSESLRSTTSCCGNSPSL